jgi:hypothetical protein
MKISIGNQITEINLKLLSVKELQKMKSEIEYEISLHSRKHSDTEYPSLLYSYLTKKFTKETKQQFPSYNIYVSITANKTTKDKLKATSEFLINYLQTIKPEADKTTTYKFFKLFSDIVTMVILEDTSLPLNFNTVLSMTESFPSMLDNEFPGYIKSGLIDFILNI